MSARRKQCRATSRDTSVVRTAERYRARPSASAVPRGTRERGSLRGAGTNHSARLGLASRSLGEVGVRGKQFVIARSSIRSRAGHGDRPAGLSREILGSIFRLAIRVDDDDDDGGEQWHRRRSIAREIRCRASSRT